MSKKTNSTSPVDGLDEATDAAATKTARKEQTPEEKDTLTAGVKLMNTIGVSANLAKVLNLVPEWNGSKEDVAPVKESVIESFGGSEKLKDYIDGDFVTDVQAFQGISKAVPVLNNIKAFYGRRENTGSKKVKFVQVSISGTIYNVDAAYNTEIATLPNSERKELLLAHKATNKVAVAEEI